MFGSDSASARFDNVNCDLADVLGTPGIDSADEAAFRVGSMLEMQVDSLPASPALYLRGRGGSVGAFGADNRTLVSAQNAITSLLTPKSRGARRASSLTHTDTRVVSKFASPSAFHQICEQTMAGRRVIGGSYRIHAEQSGAVTITGNPIGDLSARDPGPLPRPKSKSAIADAMKAQLGLSEDVNLTVETVAFPLEGGAVWAYAGSGVSWSDEGIADIRVILRADSLALLVSRDAAPSAVYGEANVFPSNPTRDASTETVRFDLSSDQLENALLDVAPNRGQRPVQPLRDWRMQVADPGFDDVSAYYHLSRAADWFHALIGDDLLKRKPFTPLKIITGERASRDAVGRFIPTEGAIAFGDGDRPGARSADICIHEFTHAVIWAARRIDEVSTMSARGLNEGYADYAQASLLANPLFGDWVRPGEARDCSSSTARFPADLATASHPYGIGTAWAAVLWDLHEELGPGIADALAFNSIFYLDETSPVSAAHTALLECDAELFPGGNKTGRHVSEIDKAFKNRLP